MSRLAHATYAARGFKAEKKELDSRIQFEIREAKRIQIMTGCSWDEALRLSKTEAEARFRQPT